MGKRQYVFDSYALLALLQNEPGAQLVSELLSDAQADVHLSTINLGEIYYILYRRIDESMAEKFVEYVLAEELEVLDVPWFRVKQAAAVKARGGLSYADSFAVALAEELGAELVTGDPELRRYAGNYGTVSIVWVGD